MLREKLRIEKISGRIGSKLIRNSRLLVKENPITFMRFHCECVASCRCLRHRPSPTVNPNQIELVGCQRISDFHKTFACNTYCMQLVQRDYTYTFVGILRVPTTYFKVNFSRSGAIFRKAEHCFWFRPETKIMSNASPLFTGAIDFECKSDWFQGVSVHKDDFRKHGCQYHRAYAH